MNGALKFGLGEMDSLYSEATGYRGQFKTAMENLDAAVSELAGYWTSEETGTYQRFQTLYKEKKAVLQEAHDYMNKFCQKVAEKREDFKEAADAVNKKAA